MVADGLRSWSAGSSWAKLGPPSSGYAAHPRDRGAPKEEDIKKQLDLIFHAPTGESPDGGGATGRVQRWKDVVRQVAASKGLTEERVEAVVRGGKPR